MDYPLRVPGFEQRQLAVRIPGFFADAQLLLDGEPVRREAKQKHYMLHTDEGTEVHARLQPVFLDPIPQLVIDTNTYRAVEPFRWYEWFWSALPMLLVVLGDVIAIAFGLLGFYVNVRMFRFRPERSFLAKISLATLVTIIALLTYIAFILALNFVIAQVRPA